MKAEHANSNTQRVTDATNDLQKLIPVGVLFAYSLPTDITDLYAIPTNGPRGTWKWLDTDLLKYRLQNSGRSLHPRLEDLCFLIHHKFAMATFKMFKALCGDSYHPIAVVRVYAVPMDLAGSRFLRAFRYDQPRSLFVDKDARRLWWELICCLDFAHDSWAAQDGWLQENLKQQTIIIPATVRTQQLTTQRHRTAPDDLNFHIKRLKDGLRFKKPTPSCVCESRIPGKRLLTIYNSIHSPDLSVHQGKTRGVRPKIVATLDTSARIRTLLKSRGSPLMGMRSTLYPFQLQSLAKMLEKETKATRRVVPNFLEIRSITGSTVYFDLTNAVFWSQPELYLLPCGGILAENMGLGKTFICLALICYTKNDLSSIPSDCILHEPSHAEAKNAPIRRLSDLCIHKINHDSLPWRYYSDDLPQSVINLLNASPGKFSIPISTEGARRGVLRSNQETAAEEGVTFRTLFLCNSTLIFVPDNLFHQWNNECKKHVDDGYLRKLFVSNQFKTTIHNPHSTYTNMIPQHVADLIAYDVVVVSQSLLLKNSLLILETVFWKRLIIDEGHTMSSKSSKTSIMCKNIRSERRWAVTGTPTSGLTRIDMDEEESDQRSSKYSVKQTINERDDLTKLGVIVGQYLKVEPYHSMPKLWTDLITKPFFDHKFSAETNLMNLLNDIVIRHSAADIERDLRLPKLHHRPVFLEPSYHNKLAINLFTAVLAVNAVSSERTDVDYMFNAANRPQLRRLVTNLQRATFHWTGFKQEDVETLISICQNSLAKHERHNHELYSCTDIRLLQDSMRAAQRVLANPRWRTASSLHEMNYYVSGLPKALVVAFNTSRIDYIDGTVLGVFGAPQIASMQEFFYKNRFVKNGDALRHKLMETSKSFWGTYWQDKTRRNIERFNKESPNQDIKLTNERVDASSQTPQLGFDHSPKQILNTKKRQAGSDETDSPKDKRIEALRTLDLQHSFFAGGRHAKILGTDSAKLSYTSARLLEHQYQRLKSLVFFEFEDSAYYLSELLDMIGVDYILYATFISPSQRAANLANFSNHEGGTALIMDLRLASHGLNIIAATRVYFLSSVWQRSVEAQAIKRAHRIGQTKEVFVETLVLKGTLEEEIYRKRSDDQDDDDPNRESQKKYVIDDTGMQEYILQHKFLTHFEGESEYSPFRAPTEIDEIYLTNGEFDESSLLEHSDIVKYQARSWNVQIFTNANLIKLNLTKNQKMNRSLQEQEYYDHLIDPDAELDCSHVALPSDAAIRPPRKKVRF